MWQNTIRKSLRLSGTGLHSGRTIQMQIFPAPCDHGIVFVRKDMSGQPRIPASIENLSHRMRCTALVYKKAQVYTTEHLLATCYAMNLDNLIIEVDGPEIPGMDGSALPFYEALKQAGIQNQDREAQEIVINQEILLQKKDSVSWQFLLKLLKIGGKGDIASLQVLPNPSGLKLEYFLDYSFSGVPRQHFFMDLSEDSFAREIAPARTFALKREMGIGQKLLGLGKGANEQNTLSLDAKGQIHGTTLRFPDEMVRHKLLDLLGDIALVGKRLKAHITGNRSGHSLNALLARKIQELC